MSRLSKEELGIYSYGQYDSSSRTSSPGAPEQRLEWNGRHGGLAEASRSKGLPVNFG
jgi:hypothetical protein